MDAPAIPNLDIAAMIPRITEEVAATIRQKTLDSFNYSVGQAVQQEVTRFIRDRIIPEVSKELEDSGPQIRAAFVAGVQGACALVAQSIVDSTKKRLAGYEGDQLVTTTMRILLGNKLADRNL